MAIKSVLIAIVRNGSRREHHGSETDTYFGKGAKINLNGLKNDGL